MPQVLCQPVGTRSALLLQPAGSPLRDGTRKGTLSRRGSWLNGRANSASALRVRVVAPALFCSLVDTLWQESPASELRILRLHYGKLMQSDRENLRQTACQKLLDPWTKTD